MFTHALIEGVGTSAAWGALLVSRPRVRASGPDGLGRDLPLIGPLRGALGLSPRRR
ncbi:hypothetical protein [Micromonospora sp. NPDC005237]|uniref:hypothetical protein n=1 Tax=Micromonospora sp. NPDC005237 TaxID=3155113 RepID=UPI0033A5605E